MSSFYLTLFAYPTSPDTASRPCALGPAHILSLNKSGVLDGRDRDGGPKAAVFLRGVGHSSFPLKNLMSVQIASWVRSSISFGAKCSSNIAEGFWVG